MSYDHIREHHGVEVTVNHFVRHAVTGRLGTVMPERDAECVEVLFQGDRHVTRCLPADLEDADVL